MAFPARPHAADAYLGPGLHALSRLLSIEHRELRQGRKRGTRSDEYYVALRAALLSASQSDREKLEWLQLSFDEQILLLHYAPAAGQSIRSNVNEWLHTLVSTELCPSIPLTYPFRTGWLAVLLSNRLSSPLVLLRIRPGRFWFSFGAGPCEDVADGAIGGACRHRRTAPSSCCSSTMTTIQTPIWPLPPSRGVQCIHLLRPSSLAFDTHLTLAVTPRPSAIAAVSSSRTRSDPPILFRNGDCRMPGTRNEGDANRILRDGYGRTSRYYAFS